MIVADLPPLEQDRIVCSISAAEAYAIPADIMLAIAEIEGGKPQLQVEGGKPQLQVANTNRTYDIGYMQFNSSYIADLTNRYSYDYQTIAEADGCYSFYLAAWRIASHIKNDKGSIWQKSANYHSRTPKYNLIYQKKLISSARKWALWLNKHFTTVNLQKEEK